MHTHTQTHTHPADVPILVMLLQIQSFPLTLVHYSSRNIPQQHALQNDCSSIKLLQTATDNSKYRGRVGVMQWVPDEDALAVEEEKRARRCNLGIQIVLGVAAITSLVLVVFFAVENAEARYCPLTYDKQGVINEADMQKWTKDVGWVITTPQWSNTKRACVCDDDPDPSLELTTRKTPAWIAPVDLYGLYSAEMAFPSGFDKTAEAPQDHVKVCLERTKLDQLWNGLNSKNQPGGSKHCHNTEPFEMFTGWDGDLYCTLSVSSVDSPQTTDKCAHSTTNTIYTDECVDPPYQMLNSSSDLCACPCTMIPIVLQHPVHGEKKFSYSCKCYGDANGCPPGTDNATSRHR